MHKREKSDYLIQAVSNALDILEQFHDGVDELGVTELCRRLSLHRSNASKLLLNLELRGYLEQNKMTQNYRLGLKTLGIGQTFIKQMRLLQRAKPVLGALVRECNETAHVAVLKDSHMVYLDAVETDMTVRVISRVGSYLPAYCTAAGKIQMAFMTEMELDKFLPGNGLKRYTNNTITDWDTLKEHLRVIAKQGYAVDNEELDVGVKCVSAPIKDYTRRIIGSVAISGPSTRFADERLKNELIPFSIKAGDEISSNLGYYIR